MSWGKWNNPAWLKLCAKWAQLYTGQTKSEAALEPAIAALGRPYRFQHPFFGNHYFVDYALLEDKIIIEVDGKSHSSKDAKAADAERTRALEKQGWTVVRCKNEDAQRDPAGTVARLLLDANTQRLNQIRGNHD